MATYESALLSGLPDGGFIFLPRGTETLVHQTSVTAGVIEEMTLRVSNRNTETIDVLVRLEKNAVLLHEHTVTIAGETTSTVMDAVPVGNDIDIKVTASLPADGVAPYGSFLAAGSNATYGVNPSTLAINQAISGFSYYTGYDSVNDILFRLDNYQIYLYRASTGDLLGQAVHATGQIRGFDFDPVRKLFVLTSVDSNPKYGYYTNETSPVVTGEISASGNNSAVAINSKAIIVFSTTWNVMYSFSLDNPTQVIGSQSSIYGVTGVVADKNSNRIAFFGGEDYPMYYMDCNGSSFGTKVNTNKYYRYAAVFHPTNGTLYAIGSASSLFVTKITAAGTVTDHAIATGHSTNNKAYLCAYSKGSDIIAFVDSNNYGGLFNAATDTDITSYLQVSTNSFVDYPLAGLDPYCSGSVDRQTP